MLIGVLPTYKTIGILAVIASARLKDSILDGPSAVAGGTASTTTPATPKVATEHADWREVRRQAPLVEQLKQLYIVRAMRTLE